ncbi:HU family DNA-binding protein [Pseudoalteromonas marina]|uniref:HU family DNA-binding protein n=1 Tax=Pseudoalteromonas marina TaxID=267375 RepID=A0ABT9FGC8_9GAMM|nr:HU family DNA-binding protein [Pseudoalteromonas marina]MDP2565803.1 HU family DNA-binding protein [Pseudoalteromonas marina]
MDILKNKTAITERLISIGGLNSKNSNALVNSTISNIQKALTDGENVTIKGFGTFKQITKASRKVLNPSTQQPLLIPEKKTVTFKPSKELIEKMKSHFMFN